tara:strand:+ start:347 stop:1459 length:1113 start_codon:yes stop_codon:yes gene_type:complete
MNPNEKIQLDDITFDDVILGDGAEMATVDEIQPPVLESSDELEKDIEDKKEEEVIEEVEAPKLKKEVKEEVKEDDDDIEPTENEGEEDKSVVFEVLEKLGFDTEGAKYDDTPEGLANLTEDVATQLAEEKMENTLSKFPLVKEHLDYVLNGGESQKFMQAYDPSLDYSKIEVKEDDVRSQKAILGDYFTVKGHDQEFIKELLEDYEDTGKLHNKAMQAKDALAKVQVKQREDMVVSQRETVEGQQKELRQYWEGVADTLEKSKDFAGLSIPEREKGKFYSYLSSPINKDGHTQRDLDHSNAQMEQKLAIDYLMYKGFNLEQIINTKAKTKATKSLREKISRNEETVKSSRAKARTKRVNVDFDDLDLSNL